MAFRAEKNSSLTVKGFGDIEESQDGENFFMVETAEAQARALIAQVKGAIIVEGAVSAETAIGIATSKGI